MATVTIRTKTKKRLAKFGNKLSSWDSIINEMIDHSESCDRWWENR